MRENTVGEAAKYVSYLRVSTQQQGAEGLGIEAQRAAVADHVRRTGGKIISEYVEVETGKDRDEERPHFASALSHVRNANAVLVIAKLDRLARSVYFTSQLMHQGVKFTCCDNPHANPLTIHILAAVAEDEAKRISARTKAALAAYKAGRRVSKRMLERYKDVPGGVPAEVVEATAGKLGASLPQCRSLTDAHRAKGRAKEIQRRAASVAARVASMGPMVVELRKSGMTLAAVAAVLNGRGFVTRAGKPWTRVAVLRMLNRAMD